MNNPHFSLSDLFLRAIPSRALSLALWITYRAIGILLSSHSLPNCIGKEEGRVRAIAGQKLR
jgi:hypothetical protein